MRSGAAVRSFDERFRGPELDLGLWVPDYLPHWTTPERSAARFALPGDGLVLRIDVDQPPWRDEDGAMRVSHLQTGSWSGPLGAPVGQHRHRPDGLLVRTPQEERRLWTPSAGSLTVTASASPDPACMLGIWLVGFEADGPEQSGELCVAELFGDRIGPAGSVVRTGVKAHHDPRLTDGIADVALPIDATRPHDYGVEWGDDGARFLVDGRVVTRTAQVLGYPLMLMLDLFEFRPDGPVDEAAYPKRAVVHRVVGVDRTP